MASGIIWVGMDVHKDSIMMAVLEGYGTEPEQVQRLPNDVKKLRRYFERLGKRGEVRARYEASGAGYVLHRDLTAWGHKCEVVAPSMTPVRPRPPSSLPMP